MKRVALIVSGGTGTRMNSKIPKQFLLLKGMPVLMQTIKQFSAFDKVILVLGKKQFILWKKLCNKYNFKIMHTLIEGGNSRFQSVKNGLAIVNNNELVAIHDGVRPIISKNLIDKLINKTKKGICVIPVIPVKDSIRKIDKITSQQVDRSNLFMVQTPQCFISDDIKQAYNQEFSNSFTDDASVFENYNGEIATSEGEEKNIKITTEEDLNIAEKFMQ